jgi:hypothetical protein
MQRPLFPAGKDPGLKFLIYTAYPDGTLMPFDMSGRWSGNPSHGFPTNGK